MQLIIERETSLVVYAFSDAIQVTIDENKLQTPDFYAWDIKIGSHDIVTVPEIPLDWTGGMYKYTPLGGWVLV